MGWVCHGTEVAHLVRGVVVVLGHCGELGVCCEYFVAESAKVSAICCVPHICLGAVLGAGLGADVPYRVAKGS